MYHDTIHINFRNFGVFTALNFDYSFLISKNCKDKFAPIVYGELMQKFEQIGFDLKYLRFNDLDDDDIVYCTYNYQPNFNIFFTAYKKLIAETNFYITFEYGNIINGVFKQNNMNYFAGVYFTKNEKNGVKEEIIKGKSFFKQTEYYQIIDKDGSIIANDNTDVNKNFETDFFQRYNVKVALRKFKLDRLKSLSS